MSSEVSSWSSIWKGGVLEVFRTSILVQSTSTSPVARLGLVCPSMRWRTSPSTRMGHSGRTVSAAAKTSGEHRSGSKNICVRPSRSRRSMKMRPPKSRRARTQPVSVTLWPMLSARSSPQVWVCREKVLMGSPFVVSPPRARTGGLWQTVRGRRQRTRTQEAIVLRRYGHSRVERKSAGEFCFARYESSPCTLSVSRSKASPSTSAQKSMYHCLE